MNTNFKILSAPLQGITDHIWRKTHSEIFGGIDEYYSPFMRIEHGEMLRRDIRDVDPGNNVGINMIPQILACAPCDAVKMVNCLKNLGYQRVDINLGCPFPPIALHHKGSGLLQYPDELKSLFEALSNINEVTYSIKMRLGWVDETEWKNIVPLFDIVHPSQITLHPRVGRQQYKGELNMSQFNLFLDSVSYPVVFNGGLHTIKDVDFVRHSHPSLSGVMIGRGLISNPAMLSREKSTEANYRKFHDTLYEYYSQHLTGGEKQVLTKMKSLWEDFLPDADHKLRKSIKKSSNLNKYEIAVDQLLSSL